jgi:hypothetical protein
MALRVETKEIPKGLDGNDGAGDYILLWDNGLEKDFQRVPCTTARFGEESSIIEEVSPEDLGYAKNEMTVRYGLVDFFTDPFPELHYPSLVRGGAEMATLTREGKKVFVSAALALHTGEAIIEDAAIQVAIDGLPHVGTQ